MAGSGAAAQKEIGGAVSTRHGIVVLDFGGQYTQLIARRIREQQVFSAILPCTASLDEIRAQEPVGIVLSGGPSSVYDADAPVCDPKVLQLGVPVLGICYGMQWLTHTLGGKVERADRREYGPAELAMQTDSPLFKGLSGRSSKCGRATATTWSDCPRDFMSPDAPKTRWLRSRIPRRNSTASNSIPK